MSSQNYFSQILSGDRNVYNYTFISIKSLLQRKNIVGCQVLASILSSWYNSFSFNRVLTHSTYT